MTRSCTDIMKAAVGTPVSQGRVITLEEFEPNIGAPFRVILVKSVRQTVSDEGKILETRIPNMAGLLREIALARSLYARKFSPAEIKFVRKAVGLKANELAGLLGVSPEHLSRCENGDRALSIAAEKLMRVIVLKRRYDYPAIRERLISLLERDELYNEAKRDLKQAFTFYSEAVAELEKAVFESRIDSVHDADEELCFEFKLSPGLEVANDNHSQEEEWRRERAA